MGTTGVSSSAHDFSFPLNVYARLLELEEGRADYLHYGLFDEPKMAAGAAQRCATELLWQHLPPPCKLLDVGLGLGTTLQRLRKAGYAAVGITPDTTQIAFARQRHGADLPALAVRFEDFDQDAGDWQAILFQESGQYIDSINLFERAADLLAPHGELIVMDEFRLSCESEGAAGLHYLAHFLRLAERFGFECLTSLDLSARAAPTVDWLLDRCRENADVLKRELGVSDGQLAELQTSNRGYQANYARRHYGYFLLRLRRVCRPRWQPGRIAGDGIAQMRALFADVFGHAMSPAHWQWKYGDGRGLGVGIWQTTANDGQPMAEPPLVAHYGGLVRDILYFGRPAQALQCGDVMVATGGRGTLSRRGPVFLSAATCLEHEIGYGTRHLVGFGFPNVRAYRLPERLGLYAEVGRMVELVWPALAVRPALRLSVRRLNPLDMDADARMNACWAAMQPGLGDSMVGVRDSRYLRHRYCSHPDKSYQLHLVQHRFGGAPLGLLVLRVVDDEGKGRRCELLDLIGAVERMPLLIHHARRVAAGLGCAQVFAWATENMLPRLALPADTQVNDLNIRIPGNAWTAGSAIDVQRGKWWLTGGDTDFH
jgi:SAM-dependent methyltransferase